MIRVHQKAVTATALVVLTTGICLIACGDDDTSIGDAADASTGDARGSDAAHANDTGATGDSGGNSTTNDGGGTTNDGGGTTNDGGGTTNDGGGTTNDGGGTTNDGGDAGCDPVTGGAVYVDPVNGSDDIVVPSGSANGSASSGCAFKTIAKAIRYLGASPAAGSKIFVVGTVTVKSSTDEPFPITLPPHTTLTGKDALTLDATTLGDNGAIVLSADGASLDGVKIVGLAGNGVLVDTGSTSATSIANTEITGFANNGIFVRNSGVVSIGANVKSNTNGYGLTLQDTAVVDISAATGVTTFNDNTNRGIDVAAGTRLTINAVPGPADQTGTVLVNGNADGIFIKGSATANAITGAVFAKNKQNGALVYDTSVLVVRNSQFLENGANGLAVSRPNGSLTAQDTVKVDLGKALDGKNVFKSNTGAGLCFNTMLVTSTTSVTLSAQGNTFGTFNCIETASTPTVSNGCGSTADIGLVTGVTAANGNKVDVTKCTTP